MKPKISIILPTYNRLDRLKKVILGLEKQTYPLDSFEVIVVSDGSSDGTDDYLKSIQTPLQLTPVFQPNQGVAATRNHGVEKAKGNILVFIDDDVFPIPEFLAEHIKVHEKEDENTVVIGPMLTPPDFHLLPWVKWSQDRLNEQYHSMLAGEWAPTARQFYTGNTSFAREIFVKYGGFDQNFRRAEDVELAYRWHKHGIKFYFCPEAIGYHYEERSFQSWLAIPYAYGCNDVIFTFKKDNAWLLPTIFKEYHDRHAITRFFVQVCLGRRGLIVLFTQGMRAIIEIGARLSIDLIARIACSSLFNLYYFQGIADELGSRQAVINAINGETISSPYLSNSTSGI
ncbi:MAG: glycosyltransferase [Anaerolineales bacterium]|nr:glycosyltransferase [Anaerolineales bacterium]